MKINYRLLNILILLAIVILGIYIYPYVSTLINNALLAIMPLILAFSLAYILNPLINLLEKIKIPRFLGIFLVYAVTVLFFIYLIFGVIKPALDDLGNISDGITNIMNEIGRITGLNTIDVTAYIIDIVADTQAQINSFFTATEGTAGDVWYTIVAGAVIVVVGIIFVFNFPKMRDKAKVYLGENVKPKTYDYVRTLDHELTTYLWAEVIIAFIQFVEYSLLMLILSFFFPQFYPLVLLVGFVAAALSLIPYFGGYFAIIFTGIIIMTQPVAAYGMIGLGIFTLIFPQLDAYVINPKIYHSQLKLNPVTTIAFVLLGQAFFGIIGAILSVPAQVIWVVTWQFYKDNFKSGIKKFNDNM